MCGSNPNSWKKWLSLAEWWYNTHYHTSSKLTPYEVVYNQPPPLHLPYLAGESVNKDIDRSLQRRETMITELKFQLKRAQERMKHYADLHRTDRVFAEGDWVWLKVVPYKQLTLQPRNNVKLSPKYSGPFQVINKIGTSAYKLQLPMSAKVHDVFHVSQLKLFRGTLPVTAIIPSWFCTDSCNQFARPSILLDKRIRPFGNAAKVEYLVQWENQLASQATWVDAKSFCATFPDFTV